MKNEAALKRLKRIEGQVRGLAKMVEEGRVLANRLRLRRFQG